MKFSDPNINSYLILNNVSIKYNVIHICIHSINKAIATIVLWY